MDQPDEQHCAPLMRTILADEPHYASFMRTLLADEPHCASFMRTILAVDQRPAGFEKKSFDRSRPPGRPAGWWGTRTAWRPGGLLLLKKFFGRDVR